MVPSTSVVRRVEEKESSGAGAGAGCARRREHMNGNAAQRFNPHTESRAEAGETSFSSAAASARSLVSAVHVLTRRRYRSPVKQANAGVLPPRATQPAPLLRRRKPGHQARQMEIPTHETQHQRNG